MSRLGTLAVAVAAAALAAGAAGCGGGDDETSSTSQASATHAWADGVCGALTTWRSDLRSATADLRSGNVSKESIQSAADDAKKATSNLVDDLDSLGKPDTPSGQKAKKTVDGLSTKLQADVDDLQSSVKSVSSASDLLTALPAVTATVKTMRTELSSAVATLKGLDARGELHDAFTQSDSCKSLSSSSGS